MSHHTLAPIFIVRRSGYPVEKLVRLREGSAGPPEMAWRSHLYEIAQDATFLTGVFLCSLDFCSRVRAFGPPRSMRRKRERQHEQTLYLYLQRFAIKNDSTASLGPVGYGLLDENDTGRIRASVRSGVSLTGKATILSYRVAESISEKLKAELLLCGDLRLRLAPTAELHLDHVEVQFPDQYVIQIPSTLFNLLERCDGSEPISDLVGSLPQRARQLARELLLKLLSLGVLTDDELTIQKCSFDPLTSVIDVMNLYSGRLEPWRRDLRTLQCSLLALNAANSLPDRIEKLGVLNDTVSLLLPDTKGEAPRSKDRFNYYEDFADLSSTTVLGRRLVGEIQNDLNAYIALAGVRAELERRAWNAFLVRHSRSQGWTWPLPLATLIGRTGEMMSDGFEDPDDWRSVREFDEALAALWLSAPDYQLLSDAVISFLAPYAKPPYFFTSPDVMFASPSLRDIQRGKYLPILSELHGGALAWSGLLRFLPDGMKEAQGSFLQDSLEGCIPTPFELTIGRRKGKSFRLPLPCLQFGFTSNAKADLPVSDLEVREVLGELRIWSRSRGERMELLQTAWKGVVAKAFALEAQRLCVGSWLPTVRRLRIGRLVVQRAQWRLTAESLGARAAESISKLRSVGLPNQFFLRADGDEKPIFIDLKMPIAVEVLSKRLRRALQVGFTEALPALEQCWYESDTGAHSSEFRMTAFYRAMH